MPQIDNCRQQKKLKKGNQSQDKLFQYMLRWINNKKEQLVN